LQVTWRSFLKHRGNQKTLFQKRELEKKICGRSAPIVVRGGVGHSTSVLEAREETRLDRKDEWLRGKSTDPRAEEKKK